MKCDSDFGEENFKILATQVLLGDIANFLQSLAAGLARLCVYSGE